MKRFFINRNTLLLNGIIVVALGLRLYQVTFGLPALYFEDEEFFVQPALRVAQGQLNPNWFGAPAQPFIYLLAVVFRSLNIIINIWQQTQLPVTQNYEHWITIFQTSGRLFSVLAGTLSVWLVYLIAKRWNERAALISAVLSATSFYLVEHSHIIRPDILQTLFLLGTLYSLIRLLDQPTQLKWYLYTTISFALAITTKYPSAFILPVLGYVVWIQRKLLNKRYLRYSIGIFCLTLFSSAPFLFIKYQTTIKHILLENSSEHGVHGGFSFFGNLWWYISDVLHWQTGTFIYLIIIATIIYFFVRQRNHKLFFIVLAALVYLVGISILKLHWERWLIPVVTLFFIIAGIGIDLLLTKLKIYPKTVSIIIIIIITLAPTMRLARLLYGFSQPYTITQAQRWITEHIPSSTTLAAEPYTPEPSNYTLLKVPNISWHGAHYYKNHGVSYFMISEYVYGTILEQETTGATQAINNYNKLFNKSQLVYQIIPNSQYTTKELLYAPDWQVLKTLRLNLYLGPYVMIYQLN